jgi:hypothetical protein
MSEEWKPKVGDVVWVKGTVTVDAADFDGDYRMEPAHSGQGIGIYSGIDGIRPDAPAMDDVAALRRAAIVLHKEARRCAAADARHLADHIEAARRVPTPLEALKDVVAAFDDLDVVDTKDALVLQRARRAIAAAEKDVAA